MTRNRVLIVDDDPLNRELIVDVLGGAGYTAFQAEEGLGLLTRARALAAGCTDFLTKPVDTHAVLSTVARFLEGR